MWRAAVLMTLVGCGGEAPAQFGDLTIGFYESQVVEMSGTASQTRLTGEWAVYSDTGLMITVDMGDALVEARLTDEEVFVDFPTQQVPGCPTQMENRYAVLAPISRMRIRATEYFNESPSLDPCATSTVEVVYEASLSN